MNWIPVTERLPKVKYGKRRDVNSVLTWWEPAPECGSHYQVCNVLFLQRSVGSGQSAITHWVELTPPKGKKGL